MGALVAQALGHAASGILSFVRQPDRWGDGRQFDHLLITGGGAEALRPQLQEAFPHGYVLPNPVMANRTMKQLYNWLEEEKIITENLAT